MMNHEYIISCNRGEILNLDLSSEIDRKIPIKKQPKPKYKNDDASKCSYCGFIAAYPWNIREHIRRCHTFERPHKCTVCGKGFVTALELRRHSYKHTGEKPFNCKYCNKSFAHRSLRNEHEDSHGLSQHKCRHCDIVFYNRKERVSHEKANHIMTNEHQCAKCFKVFANVRCLELHKEKMNNHEKYTCDICQDKFPSKSTYYAHKKIHRSQTLQYRRPRQPRSKFCDASIKPCAFLPQNCNFCTEYFTLRIEYHNHLEAVHPREKDQILCYPCEICGKRFDEPHLVVSHKNYVHREKRVSCSKCSYKCRKNQELEKHLRKHMKRFLYKRIETCNEGNTKESVVIFGSQKCSYCSKSFTLRKDYHCHLEQMHPNEHKEVLCFPCNFCSKVFDDHELLQHHKHVTHREKRMVCNQCNYKCHKKQAMDLHILTHRADASFLCETCGKTYRSKKGLKTHSLSHIQNDNIDDQEDDTFKQAKTISIPQVSSNYNSNPSPKLEKRPPIKIGVEDVLGKKHICSHCTTKFSSKYSLEKHLYELHQNEIRNCKTCIQSNLGINELLLHMEEHPREPDYLQSVYECFACGMLFETEMDQSKHLKTHGIT